MEIEIKIKGCPFEDAEDIAIFVHARELYSAIWETRRKIRSRLKYDENITESEAKFLEELRDELTLECIDLG